MSAPTTRAPGSADPAPANGQPSNHSGAEGVPGRVAPQQLSGAEAVVLSLGVDAAAADPESPLRVSADGYRAAGALVGGLGVPVVAVQEGGYHLETLGGLVAATLAGLGGG